MSALLAAGPASAEYICSAAYDRGSVTHGRVGGVSINLTSGNACTGTNLGWFYLCSADPVSTGLEACAGAPYQLSESSLLAQMQLLRAAIDSNQRVSRYLTSCAGSGSSCLAYLRFWAN